jgi:hypothetical protein
MGSCGRLAGLLVGMRSIPLRRAGPGGPARTRGSAPQFLQNVALRLVGDEANATVHPSQVPLQAARLGRRGRFNISLCSIIVHQKRGNFPVGSLWNEELSSRKTGKFPFFSLSNPTLPSDRCRVDRSRLFLSFKNTKTEHKCSVFRSVVLQPNKLLIYNRKLCSVWS